MGSLSTCFETRLTRDKRENNRSTKDNSRHHHQQQLVEGAIDLECAKFSQDFEQNVEWTTLLNRPTKNDWVCLAQNNTNTNKKECESTNRRGGLFCRMCGHSYQETVKIMKAIERQKRIERQKQQKRDGTIVNTSFNEDEDDYDGDAGDDNDDDGDNSNKDIGSGQEGGFDYMNNNGSSLLSFSKQSSLLSAFQSGGGNHSVGKQQSTRKKLAEAMTFQEVREEQLKKRFPVWSFVFFICFIYVLVPFVVAFNGICFSAALSKLEGWTLQHAFFFIVGEIVKSPINLNQNSAYPTSDAGVFISVALSIWSYLIILTTVALLHDLEIIKFWSQKMEHILIDFFRVSVISDSDTRERELGGRISLCSFKVGEIFGIMTFTIIVAPFVLLFVASIATLLLYETEGISYRKALMLTLRGLSLGKSYDVSIITLDNDASLVYILFLCCTEMGLGTVFVGFLFQSHFKKSWLPAKWARKRRENSSSEGGNTSTK
jgi:hypothetical protein